MRGLAALGLFTAIVSPITAADEWKHIATPNFELYTTAGARDARNTIEYFEQVRDFFLRATSGKSTTPVPVTIVAFKNHGQFKPYSPSEVAAAFYTGTSNHDYIIMAGTGMDHYPVAVHEYMHLLIRHMDLEIPLWLNEGLAEVYSTLKPQGGKLLVGAVPEGRAPSLLSGKWLPAARLLAVDRKSPEYNEKDRAGVFYAQSWALVHMMMLDPEWRAGFPKFVSAVAGGVAAEQAFRDVWGVTLDQLTRKLQGYVRSQSLMGALFDMKLEKFGGLEARPADADDVEIVLGTVMGLVGKTAEGTKRLEAVAARRDKDYKVHEALGVLAIRTRDHDKARRHFGRATELGSPHWNTWWDYARLLYSAPAEDRKAIVQVLSKVVSMNASQQEARFLLAEEYNRARQPGAALATLNGVNKVKAADAPRLFLSTAYALAQMDKDAEAQQALERARKYAKEPRDVSQVEELGRWLAARAQRREAPGPSVVAVPQAPAGVAGSQEEAPEEQRLAVRGVFAELDCSLTPARFVVATDSGPVRLAITDAASITVDGSNRERPLTCGPQADKRKVKAEYLPMTGRDVRGQLRAITFE